MHTLDFVSLMLNGLEAGGTNDVVAYRMTDLCMKAENGQFPA